MMRLVPGFSHAARLSNAGRVSVSSTPALAFAATKLAVDEHQFRSPAIVIVGECCVNVTGVRHAIHHERRNAPFDSRVLLPACFVVTRSTMLESVFLSLIFPSHSARVSGFSAW